jgi:hypothetical protein
MIPADVNTPMLRVVTKKGSPVSLLLQLLYTDGSLDRLCVLLLAPTRTLAYLVLTTWLV